MSASSPRSNSVDRIGKLDTNVPIYTCVPQPSSHRHTNCSRVISAKPSGNTSISDITPLPLPLPLRLTPVVPAVGKIEFTKRKLQEAAVGPDRDRTVRQLLSACDHRIGHTRRTSVDQLVDRLETQQALNRQRSLQKVHVVTDPCSTSKRNVVHTHDPTIEVQRLPLPTSSEPNLSRDLRLRGKEAHSEDRSHLTNINRNKSCTSSTVHPAGLVIESPYDQSLPLSINLDLQQNFTKHYSSASSQVLSVQMTETGESEQTSVTAVHSSPEPTLKSPDLKQRQGRRRILNLSSGSYPVSQHSDIAAEAYRDILVHGRSPALDALSRFDVPFAAGTSSDVVPALSSREETVNNSAVSVYESTFGGSDLKTSTSTSAHSLPEIVPIPPEHSTAVSSGDLTKEFPPSAEPIPIVQVSLPSSPSSDRQVSTFEASNMANNNNSASAVGLNDSHNTQVSHDPSLADMDNVNVGQATDAHAPFKIPAPVQELTSTVPSALDPPTTSQTAAEVANLPASNKLGKRQKAVKLARKVLLRRRILMLVLGRQLGGLTHSRIRQGNEPVSIVPISTMDGAGWSSMTNNSSVFDAVPRQNPALDPTSPTLDSQPRQTWQQSRLTYDGTTPLRQEPASARRKKRGERERARLESKRLGQEMRRNRKALEGVRYATQCHGYLSATIEKSKKKMEKLPRCKTCGKDFPSNHLDALIRNTIKRDQPEVALQVTKFWRTELPELAMAKSTLRNELECSCSGRKDLHTRSTPAACPAPGGGTCSGCGGGC